MNIFPEQSYKKIIELKVKALKRSQGSAYTLGRLAKASGVQQTFLSRVFREDKAHLNSDQLFHALEFLGFSSEEREFITLLHEFERSGSKARREVLNKEIETFRRRHLSTQGATNVRPLELSTEQESLYFLDPEAQAFHILLTIPRFAAAPERCALALGLSKQRYRKLLESLIALRVIDVLPNGSAKVLRTDLHLSSESAIFPAYRRLMRAFAVERLGKHVSQEGYTLSVLLSVDDPTRLAIQQRFLEFLNVARTLVKDCETPTIAFQMVFDLFPLVGSD